MTRLLSIPLLASITLAAPAPQKTFIFGNSSRDINEFRAFAKIAAKFKRYGNVQIDIGVLAEKSRYEMPPGGSPWHEYANFHANMAKFFPHPKVAPFIPADWVAKNRELLLAKAAVLRELGLEAAFSSHDTHFLSEAFFRQYPHLRGPRVDHPRRSKREEFAWCVDLQETRDMIEWMTAELIRNVPEIKSLTSLNNDSGAGLCWAAAQYSGPNGPRHCAGRSVGIRVKELAEAIHRGAQKAGGKIVLRFGGNFWQNEEDIIQPHLPPDTYLARRDPAAIGTGSLINDAYPVLGLMDPLAMITSLERSADPNVRRISIGSTFMYRRADEPLATVERIVEIAQDSVAEPARGLTSRLDKLRRLALRWGGQNNAEALFEAFYRMHEAFRMKQAVAPRYSNVYCGVSMRHVTRPLLITPGTLAPDEEAYFLPHIFNIHEAEARNDYIDLHGSRISGPAAWTDAGLRGALNDALAAARTFESLKGAPEEKWLRQLALSLRMWASEVRSIHNFYFAQLVRDRNSQALAGPPRIPPKVATWFGDNDYLEWNGIQRDELDNANELIALLKDGGLNWIARAKDGPSEDTFLLGPDVAGALDKKTALMRAHWLDVQKYLASPHK